MMAIAPALLGATAGAAPACDAGSALITRYSYCFFETTHAPAEDGYNETTGAARMAFAAGTTGTELETSAFVLEDAQETTSTKTTRWGASGTTTELRVLYRTSVTADAGAGQREEGAAGESAALGSVVVDDPLLRRTVVGTGYHQDAPEARPCEQGVEARAAALSDSVGVAPGVPCVIPLPWLDAALVTVAVANALP